MEKCKHTKILINYDLEHTTEAFILHDKLPFTELIEYNEISL